MSTREHKFECGDSLKDSITGYKGVVMVVSLYSTGCTHYGLLKQKVKAGEKLPGWEYFDESRLTLVKKGAVKFNIPEGTTSGPCENPPQMP